MRTFFIFYIVLAGLCPEGSVSALAPFNSELNLTGPDSSDLKYLNWYNDFPENNGKIGTGVDKAFTDFLQNKKSKTVIVAVIDGGVDINHEDLQGRIWKNEKEIENNGVDDDNNGYIDDLHGWNYIGNSKGVNINYETYELTRIVKKYSKKFENISPVGLSPAEQVIYNVYKRAREEFDKKVRQYLDEKQKIDQIYKGYIIASNNIKSFLKKDTITAEDLRFLQSDEEIVNRSRKYLLYLNEISYTLKDLEEIKENNYNHLFYHLNLDYNPREENGDNPEMQDGKSYGNNDVTGEKAEHGTFVSGIIAGIRNNNIGINGIAADVKIMSLRVVPDGDERDKDIANAIFYALNNGAQVINCSFGKEYSPQREFVDEALKAARDKGVIIVHAAGNEASDNDKIPHYPIRQLLNGEILSDNWITVGASTMKADKNLPGVFSNYGLHEVDVFAPGVDIYSLHPENTYKLGDGTSYSCPVVTGIVALLKSYYPELLPGQIKKIILESTTPFPKLKVYQPNKNSKKSKKTRFGKLSVSGGIVNAYEAIKLAEKLSSGLQKINPEKNHQ